MQASPCATVFQTWQWQAAWWAHYSKYKRLWAMAFVDDTSGAIVGFAALFLPALLSPTRTVRFVGTGGSDYLDILALPGREAEVGAAFARQLDASRKRWDWADLQQVRPGAVCDALEGGQESDLHTAFWEGEVCPQLTLPPGGDWETVRKSFGKKLRQNIAYYDRALQKQYVVEYRVATLETLEGDLDAFFNLHQRRWNQRWLPGAFASRQARTFHADAARRLAEAEMLRLHTLTLDGQIEAALYCFQKGQTCSYYLGGFEPTLAKWSLGTVLTARAIQYAVEHDGATVFDFLRGNEPYKYKWGAQNVINRRVSVTHRGFRPALLQTGGRVSLRLEQRLKTWMHHKHGGKNSSKK